MTNETVKPLAIIAEIESPDTGAIANYHVPVSKQEDFLNNKTRLTFASYISERTYLAGKQSVGHIYIEMTETLEPISRTMLQKVVALQGHELSGGKLSAINAA